MIVVVVVMYTCRNIWTNGTGCHVFSPKCPLSHRYEAEFTSLNETFSSANQFYQAQKARYAADFDAESAILSAESEREIDAIAAEIRGLSQWEKQAAEVMLVANKLKFAHCLDLQSYLLDTENLRLVYADPEAPFWSTGLPFYDESNLLPKLWLGKNVLGRVLQKVRTQLLP